MPYLATVDENSVSQQVTDVFAGYNHKLKISDGEFYETMNLTTDYYPMLANRVKRGAVSTLTSPGGLLAKEYLAYVDNGKLYYNGAEVSGLTLTSGEKQLVSMGAYLIIFPDKKYVNTSNLSDYGSMDSTFTTYTSSVEYSLCDKNGSQYQNIATTKPATPTAGQYWLDTTQSPHVLMQYNDASSQWVSIPTVYVRIKSTGIGQPFSEFDGVTLSGISYTGSTTGVAEQYAALNGTKIIYAKDENWIVVVGLVDEAFTQTETNITVSRAAPDMDYVCESQNRLWGCKFGRVDGENINELYACKLGDFKNWNCFLGISTDSWAASVGADGAWTGCINYQGTPCFFKEESIHRISISSSGAHQISETKCRGVQQGSARSLCVVNEVLFYKGVTDICSYDGSYPNGISEALGGVSYSGAVAGSVKGKYYISMKDSGNTWHLFVYDSAKGLWIHEDNTHALCFTTKADELYFIHAGNNKLYAVNGSAGTAESTISWSATTGLIGYSTVEQKYISRFNLRMKLPQGSKADLYIEYDSDGVWNHCGHMEGTGTRTFMLPVRPRRCDHFRIRIEGSGDIRVYSFAKIFEQGSDF